MPYDLIHAICGGLGERFQGECCQHFIAATGECTLLKIHEMDEIWENGRCEPKLMAYRAEHKILEQFHRQKPWIDEREEIDFEKIEYLLKISRDLKAASLPVYYQYIRKTVYHEIFNTLATRGFIPRRKECGVCLYLSSSKPYTCQREEIVDPEKQEKVENTFYGALRNKTGDTCEGFVFNGPTMVEIPKEGDCELADVNDQTAAYFPVEEIRDKLERRADEAKRQKRNHEGNMYERQLVVFMRLYQLLSEDCEENEAVKEIAKEAGVAERTIRRDIEAIREYLRGTGMGQGGYNEG